MDDDMDDDERALIAARNRGRGKRRSSIECHERISEISAAGSVDPTDIIQQLLVRARIYARLVHADTYLPQAERFPDGATRDDLRGFVAMMQEDGNFGQYIAALEELARSLPPQLLTWRVVRCGRPDGGLEWGWIVRRWVRLRPSWAMYRHPTARARARAC